MAINPMWIVAGIQLLQSLSAQGNNAPPAAPISSLPTGSNRPPPPNPYLALGSSPAPAPTPMGSLSGAQAVAAAPGSGSMVIDSGGAIENLGKLEDLQNRSRQQKVEEKGSETTGTGTKLKNSLMNPEVLAALASLAQGSSIPAPVVSPMNLQSNFQGGIPSPFRRRR